MNTGKTMKHITLALCFFLMAMSVQARAIREEMNLSDENERMSYAFGMTIGIDLLQSGLEVDYASFTEGLRAAMEGRDLKLDQEQAMEIVQSAFQNAMDRQFAELRDMELLFLAENAARDDITVTESGLQFMVIDAGDGPRPSSGDTVLVHYEGALIDGSVFDSSYEQGYPEEIPLDFVIPGWAEGLLLMNTGGRYRLYIPSQLAYGEHGAGPIIPPYSTLIFTIELLDIVTEE